TMPQHGTSVAGIFFPLRPRAPCRTQCRPSIRPCGFLSATFRPALRRPFRLPFVLPCGCPSGFGGLPSPNWCNIALPVAEGQCDFAKSRPSPHLFTSHPQCGPENPQLIPMGPELRNSCVATQGTRRRVRSQRGDVGARDPAVDEKRRRRHERCVIGGEKCGGGGDLCGLAETTHRDVHQASRRTLGVFGEELLEQRRV